MTIQKSKNKNKSKGKGKKQIPCGNDRQEKQELKPDVSLGLFRHD
jgi:hypothetical protein